MTAKWKPKGAIIAVYPPVAHGDIFHFGVVTAGGCLLSFKIDPKVMRDLARALFGALGEMPSDETDRYRAARIDCQRCGMTIEAAAGKHQVDPEILCTWINRLRVAA